MRFASTIRHLSRCLFLDAGTIESVTDYKVELLGTKLGLHLQVEYAPWILTISFKNGGFLTLVEKIETDNRIWNSPGLIF